jgi:hypothetical protein
MRSLENFPLIIKRVRLTMRLDRLFLEYARLMSMDREAMSFHLPSETYVYHDFH